MTSIVTNVESLTEFVSKAAELAKKYRLRKAIKTRPNGSNFRVKVIQITV